MRLQKEYKTVFQEACEEIVEKKSRFIASVKPVADEEEAVAFIQGLKTKYWDATHNVFAYYIEGETTAQRYSDDGEPSGTAGLPVLEAIRKSGIQDVVVVVTRYFGGTLLGAAGLVRAYGKSASEGLRAARIVRKMSCNRIHLVMEYPLLGKVKNYLEGEGYIIENVEYEIDVTMTILTELDKTETLIGEINELTGAGVLVENAGTCYVTIDQENRVLAF